MEALRSVYQRYPRAIAAAGAAAGLYAAVQVAAAVRPDPNVARRAQQDPDTVHLWVFPRRGGAVGISGPCLKAEAMLRIAGVKYQAWFSYDCSQSPTERLPLLEYGDNVVPDSVAIGEWLEARGMFTPPKLSAEQEATAMSIEALSEEMRIAYIRYMLVDHTDLIPWLDLLPGTEWMQKQMMHHMFRKGAISWLNNHGFGDLSEEQYHQRWLRTTKALEVYAEKASPFVFGAEATAADAALWASIEFMRNVSKNGLAPPAVAHINNSRPLKQYAETFERRFFRDTAYLRERTPGNRTFEDLPKV